MTQVKSKYSLHKVKCFLVLAVLLVYLPPGKERIKVRIFSRPALSRVLLLPPLGQSFSEFDMMVFLGLTLMLSGNSKQHHRVGALEQKFQTRALKFRLRNLAGQGSSLSFRSSS